MIEKGKAVTDGDTVKIVFERCERCDVCHECKVFGDERHMARDVENTLKVHEGDYVLVRTRTSLTPLFILLNWLMPLALVGIGIGFCELIADRSKQIILLTCMFILGIVISALTDKFAISKSKLLRPKMIAVCEECEMTETQDDRLKRNY